MKIDSVASVRLLLSAYHAIKERKYVGSESASDILLDLHEAIRSAALTAHQYSIIRMKYIDDLSWDEIGSILGITKQAVNQSAIVGMEKILAVYKNWNQMEAA